MAALVAGDSVVSYTLADGSAVPALVEGIVSGTVLSLYVFDPSGYFKANAVSFSASHAAGTWDYRAEPVLEASMAAADADYTLGTEFGLVVDSTDDDVAVTLPPVADCAGRMYVIKKAVAANTVTVAPDGDDTATIDGAADYEMDNVNASVTLLSDGAEWWVIGSAAGTAP